MASKTFFSKLKETCRTIDSDVNDIKMKMIATHEDDDNEEIVSKKICEIQDKINSMKVSFFNRYLFCYLNLYSKLKTLRKIKLLFFLQRRSTTLRNFYP